MTQSRKRGGMAAVLSVAMMALAWAVPAAPAAEPAPGYERFAGCPSPDEVPAVEGCVRSVISSGHFQMGSKNVSIKNPITLTAGVTGSGDVFFNSKGGLTPVKQEIPGGIVGLTGLDWLVNFLGVEALKVYAVTELAGTPTNLSLNSVTLPVKVHLVNPVLGNNCYVGSSSNPIVLNLFVGTTNPPPPNEPITGVEPEASFDPETGIIHLDNGTFVDNAFAAPGASGCKLTLLGLLPIDLNGLVNAQSGLPSPAGTNETVQNFDNEIALSESVFP